MLSDALFDPKASFIVAEDGEGGVLGYAGLQVVLDEGYIDNIAVEEAARRHGVGDALLEVADLLPRSHKPSEIFAPTQVLPCADSRGSRHRTFPCKV